MSVNIAWLRRKQFVATDSGKHSVVVSSSDDGIGMSPKELLLASVGSCTAYDIANIFTKQRKNMTALDVQVDGQTVDETPRRYTDIHIHYVVEAADITDAELTKTIGLSRDKYCSVSATLEGSVNITYSYSLNGGERVDVPGVHQETATSD